MVSMGCVECALKRVRGSCSGRAAAPLDGAPTACTAHEAQRVQHTTHACHSTATATAAHLAQAETEEEVDGEAEGKAR